MDFNTHFTNSLPHSFIYSFIEIHLDENSLSSLPQQNVNVIENSYDKKKKAGIIPHSFHSLSFILVFCYLLLQHKHILVLLLLFW